MDNTWIPEAEKAATDENGQQSFQDALLLACAWSLDKIADELKRMNDRAGEIPGK